MIKKMIIGLMIILGSIANAEWKMSTMDYKDDFGDIIETRANQISQTFKTNKTDVDLYIRITDYKFADESVTIRCQNPDLINKDGIFKVKDDKGQIYIFHVINDDVDIAEMRILNKKEHDLFVKLLKENHFLKISYVGVSGKYNTTINSKIDSAGFTKLYNKMEFMNKKK